MNTSTDATLQALEDFLNAVRVWSWERDRQGEPPSLFGRCITSQDMAGVIGKRVARAKVVRHDDRRYGLVSNYQYLIFTLSDDGDLIFYQFCED